MAGPRYLVRHGDYNKHPREMLTAHGIQDAEFAGTRLVQKGLGSNALLLASSAPRAMQTAEIIGAALTGGSSSMQVYGSDFLNEGGNFPYQVKSLQDYIAQALEEFHLDEGQGDGLVVVTHRPLISLAMMRQPAPELGFGGINDMTGVAWENPKYVEPSEHE